MTNELDTESRDILEAKLKNFRDEPLSTNVKNNVNPDDNSRLDIDSRAERLDKIMSQYKDIATLADEMQLIIESRSKDVTVSFNPDSEVTLRDSIRRVFGIDTDIVTYDMYKKCLLLKEELAEEDRQSLKEL